MGRHLDSLDRGRFFNSTWRVSTLVDYDSFLLFPRLLVFVVGEIRKNFVLDQFLRAVENVRWAGTAEIVWIKVTKCWRSFPFPNEIFLSLFIPDSLILVQRTRNKIFEIVSMMKFCGTLNRMILSLNSWESGSEIDILFIYRSDLVRTKCRSFRSSFYIFARDGIYWSS